MWGVRFNEAHTHVTPTCVSSLESVAYNAGKMLPADSSMRSRRATVDDMALARVLSMVARAEY